MEIQKELKRRRRKRYLRAVFLIVVIPIVIGVVGVFLTFLPARSFGRPPIYDGPASIALGPAKALEIDLTDDERFMVSIISQDVTLFERSYGRLGHAWFLYAGTNSEFWIWSADLGVAKLIVNEDAYEFKTSVDIDEAPRDFVFFVRNSIPD